MSWPQKRAITRAFFFFFFNVNDLFVCQSRHLVTNHLLFFLSHELPSSPVKPQATVSFMLRMAYKAQLFDLSLNLIVFTALPCVHN